MRIQKIDPSDHYRVQQFVDLPLKIYQDTPQWVPPLSGDNERIFDLEHHPFYRHSEAAFFLALAADGTSVGRLAVLNNRRFNDYNHEQTAFFYLFECMHNLDTANGLFKAGIDWAQQQGLNKINGPRGFSALDGLGMLVKGFEHRPAFGIPYNPPYYPELVEASGFRPQSDIVSGYLAAGSEFPERIHAISDLVKRRRGLSIASYQTRRDLRKLTGKLRDLYNGMIQGTTGNVPLTDEEVETIANQLLRFADPKLIKVIMKGETPVGFLFAYPDISAAFQRTRGRLFPFGWIDMLIEMRRTEWVNINGTGILPEYQGLGGTAILFSEMHKSITLGKFKHAEIVQIGVDNDKMQRELRELGIDFYKTHRMYEKSL
ncbi:MAG TPA: hypothetical protein VLD65_08065 [Anaerolineales bacterium]|nr:hypothetical protein [Anaerolineales bacterium]